MRVLLARRFRENRNAAQQSQEEEGGEEKVDGLQGWDETDRSERQDKEGGEGDNHPTALKPKQPNQQQNLPTASSLTRKRKAQSQSGPKKEKTNGSSSSEDTAEIIPEIRPVVREPTDSVSENKSRINNNGKSKNSSPTGGIELKTSPISSQEAPGAAERLVEKDLATSRPDTSLDSKTSARYSTKDKKANCTMVSAGGRQNHYRGNRNIRDAEEEDKWRYRNNSDIDAELHRVVLRRTDNPSESHAFEDQQCFENDPASARGDTACFSSERLAGHTRIQSNGRCSSATNGATGNYAVPEREGPFRGVSGSASAPLRSDNGKRRASEHGDGAAEGSGPNHLTKEEIRFRNVLKRERGLEIREQAGDGNCLFRAISLQVYGDPSMHTEVRKRCMDHMERDQEHFSQFVTGEPFLRYIARTRRDGVHGNNSEIQASSELFNRPIEVFTPQNGAVPLNIFHAEYKTGDVPIRLSYHDGNHYNAVIDPLAPTAGLGLGLPGLQPPGYADKMQMTRAVAESIATQEELALRRVMDESRSEYLRKTGRGTSENDSDDDLQRAIKESRLSAEQMNRNNALSLSDMDATYFDLEQAALENSLQSLGQKEEGKKQRASTGKAASQNINSRKSSSNGNTLDPKPATRGDRKVAASLPKSTSVDSLPCPSRENIPKAATASAAASTAARMPANVGASSQQPLLPLEQYPSVVREMVSNGFHPRCAANAYELVGDNFDDMLSLCLSTNDLYK